MLSKAEENEITVADESGLPMEVCFWSSCAVILQAAVKSA